MSEYRVRANGELKSETDLYLRYGYKDVKIILFFNID